MTSQRAQRMKTLPMTTVKVLRDSRLILGFVGTLAGAGAGAGVGAGVGAGMVEVKVERALLLRSKVFRAEEARAKVGPAGVAGVTLNLTRAQLGEVVDYLHRSRHLDVETRGLLLMASESRHHFIPLLKSLGVDEEVFYGGGVGTGRSDLDTQIVTLLVRGRYIYTFYRTVKYSAKFRRWEMVLLADEGFNATTIRDVDLRFRIDDHESDRVHDLLQILDPFLAKPVDEESRTMMEEIIKRDGLDDVYRSLEFKIPVSEQTDCKCCIM